MNYMALDLGVTSGFAVGSLGSRPRSGYVVLKRRGEGQDIAFSNFIAWLYDEWTPRGGLRRAPEMMAIEKPMNLGAFTRVRSSEDNVLMHYGLRSIAMGMCRRFGVVLVLVDRKTVLKHFVGNGNLKREEGKLACLNRCHQLKLMRPDQYSEDQADAVATHSWLCSTHGKQINVLNELHLFGSVR